MIFLIHRPLLQGAFYRLSERCRSARSFIGVVTTRFINNLFSIITMPKKYDPTESHAERAHYTALAEDHTHKALKPGHSVLSPQLLRSGIFATCARKASKLKAIPLYDDVSGLRGTVEYRGEQLTQADLRVLLGLLELAQGKPTARPITFNATDFLTRIGRSTCARGRRALEDSLGNLRSATFTVRSYDGARGVIFGLLDSVPNWDVRECTVLLSPSAPGVMKQLGYTYLNTEKRRLLADGLQTALADLIAATSATSYDVDALAAIWNREDVAQVGKDVRSALARLVEVGLIASWSATRGRVHIVRVQAGETVDAE